MLIFFAACFWAGLRYAVTFNPTIHGLLGVANLALIVLCWAGIIWKSLHRSLEDLCLLTACAVPLEFSGSVLGLPSLSPLDFLVVAIVIIVLIRLGFLKALQSLKTLFGMKEVAGWGLFFIYAGAAALALHGNVRGACRWVEFLFIYWLAATTYRQAAPQAAGRLSLVLTVMGGLMALLALFQYGTHSSAFYGFPTGTFGQHNILGAFLSLTLPAAFAFTHSNPYRKWIPWVILLAFFVSYSRGAWLGLTVAAFVFAYRQWGTLRVKPRTLVGFGVLVLAIGIPAVLSMQRSMFDSGQRTLYWEAGYSILQRHPVVGLGPGNYHAHIFDYLSAKSRAIYEADVFTHHTALFWQHLHNFYLQVMVEYGLFGGAILVGALGLLVYRALRRKPSSPYLKAFQVSVIAFFIHNTVDIVTVNSFDLVIALMLAACTFL